MNRSSYHPHRYRDATGDLWVDGEADMGRYRVPPMPVRMALVDRVTGLTFVLGHNADHTFALLPIDRSMRDVTIYGPREGPYSNGWRLYLSNGVLAFELVVSRVSYSSPRILTRRAFDTTVLEITVNPATGGVVYTQVDL